MSLYIKTRERRPTFFELSLQGRLDTMTHKQFTDTVDYLFESTVKGMQLNLEQLEYISSMGLRVILQALKRAKTEGATFMITNVPPQIKAVFDVAQALPTETVFADEAEADAYFDSVQRKALEQ